MITKQQKLDALKHIKAKMVDAKDNQSYFLGLCQRNPFRYLSKEWGEFQEYMRAERELQSKGSTSRNFWFLDGMNSCDFEQLYKQATAFPLTGIESRAEQEVKRLFETWYNPRIEFIESLIEKENNVEKQSFWSKIIKLIWQK